MPGYVPGEQPQAGKFIKLNTNENPYPASPAVGRAIAAVLERGLQRYPDPLATAFRRPGGRGAGRRSGLDSVRQRQRRYSDDRHAGLRRAGRVAAAAVSQLHPLQDAGPVQGAEAEEIRFQPDWSLGDDFCAPWPRLRLAFLPNPNSPSGTMLPPERILELAERLPCPLLVDEAYVDFADDELPASWWPRTRRSWSRAR